MMTRASESYAWMRGDAQRGGGGGGGGARPEAGGVAVSAAGERRLRAQEVQKGLGHGVAGGRAAAPGSGGASSAVSSGQAAALGAGGAEGRETRRAGGGYGRGRSNGAGDEAGERQGAERSSGGDKGCVGWFFLASSAQQSTRASAASAVGRHALARLLQPLSAAATPLHSASVAALLRFARCVPLCRPRAHRLAASDARLPDAVATRSTPVVAARSPTCSGRSRFPLPAPHRRRCRRSANRALSPLPFHFAGHALAAALLRTHTPPPSPPPGSTLAVAARSPACSSRSWPPAVAPPLWQR
uniref:Uncharacterized protein n=1 Tax=Oryza sativa subsp. japonica TaxID=39947 RepID=Q6EU05_ORYSJ|nr:hypothetical protein [Oryza sativa Japonica Group]BAD27865.1 hypothetical protein [Oryza sativa Japonica Group]